MQKNIDDNFAMQHTAIRTTDTFNTVIANTYVSMHDVHQLDILINDMEILVTRTKTRTK